MLPWLLVVVVDELEGAEELESPDVEEKADFWLLLLLDETRLLEIPPDLLLVLLLLLLLLLLGEPLLILMAASWSELNPLELPAQTDAHTTEINNTTQKLAPWLTTPPFIFVILLL